MYSIIYQIIAIKKALHKICKAFNTVCYNSYLKNYFTIFAVPSAVTIEYTPAGKVEMSN